MISERYECVQLATDGEGPIELLDDEEEEVYDEEEQAVEYDEAGNPIVTEYVEVEGGDYEEGEGAEGAEGEQSSFLKLPAERHSFSDMLDLGLSWQKILGEVDSRL